MKEILEGLYGPQIIGLIFILFGFIQKVKVPKKMNGSYGYNSPAALTSPEVWAEANRYAPIIMLKIGAVLVVIGFALMRVAKFVVPINAAWTPIGMFGVLAAAFIGGLVMRNKTERHIKQKFGLDAE